MPEPGQHDHARWHVGGWTLRTKVAVVLLLPTTVALVLGGLRVQTELHDASQRSTVRDQLTVLGGAVDLANLLSDEMVAAMPGGAALQAKKGAVDEAVARVRQGTGSTGLPAEVEAGLTKGLDQLTALRAAAAGPNPNPTNEIAGYYDTLSGLSELTPGIVAPVRDGPLEHAAGAVSSLVRLRGILAIEEIVLRFASAAAPVDAGTLQRSAAEEVLLSEQIRRDLPAAGTAAANTAAFNAATDSATSRREAFQAAVTGTAKITPAALIPAITAESQALQALAGDLVGALTADVTRLADQARADALRDAAIVLGSLLAALVLALIVARSLLAPVGVLRAAALDAAHRALPETVERVRTGELIDWQSVEPVPVRTGEEIGQLARAFDEMHQQAVRLAGEQALLRRQVSDMFTTLSRRSQSLVELQLEVIEELESEEQDPKLLEGLFRLDHLATRLRRNGENLQVLAGGTPARRGQGPVPVVELLRAATSEVNDYRRVGLGHAPHASVRGNAAADLVHMVAELLENAIRFSPPSRKVVLTADRGSDGGLLIEVVDAGLGIAADDLVAVNLRLATADDVDPETTRRMGLYVVSKLAERHGVTVRLRPTYDTATQAGITASVHVPAALVIAGGTAGIPFAEVAAAPVTNGADHAPRSWFVSLTEVDTPVAARPVERVPSGPVVKSMTASAATSTVTSAGLPMRRPGMRPVATGPDPEPVAARAGVRDPEAIRSNLARHYSGVRAARRQIQTEPEVREDP